MSDNAHPELQAFRELEALVRRLGDELATFRERAFAAEERLREIDSASDHPDPPRVRERIRALEQENASLRKRLDLATSRTRSVLDRVQFLRQQAQAENR
jgi:predicted  nucleic acid-binding Zn-ribbon protein